MATFFTAPQDRDMGEVLSSGYKAGYEMREGERKKALQNISSSMLTSAGTLPTEFIKEAASKGIGLEGLEAYFNNLKANALTASEVARASTELEGLGRNPDAGREWRDNPQNITTISTEQDPRINTTNDWLNAPISQLETAKPSQFLTGTAVPSPSTTYQATESPSVSVDGSNIDLGQGTLTAKEPRPLETFTLPADNEPGYNYTIKEPKEYSAVEEMLRRTGKNPLEIGDVGSAGGVGPTFDYTALSNSAGGVELKSGIDNALRKLGKEPSQEAVNQLLSYAASTVPAPRAHYKDGKFDLEGTLADKNDYNAKVTKAKQDMIEKLVSGNSTAIGEVLAQSGNVRAEEQQKYDLAGQKTNIFTRPVSKDEAARVRVLNETVDDVIGAKKIGGFEGDYQAAVAKAKADGSVNRDVIVANLIAMGSVPSPKAIFVKSMLDANGNLVSDLYNLGKGEIGKFVADEKKRNAWYNGTVENMIQSLARNGGIARSIDKTPIQPNSPEPKKTDAEKFAGRKGKDAAKPNPITPKPSNPSNPSKKGRTL